MRIATLSLNINAPDFNYGAILHSWAFARFLRKLPNVEKVTVLNYTMPKLEGQNLKNPILDCIFRFNIPRAFRLAIHYSGHKTKYMKFQEFIKKMPVSSKAYTQSSLKEEYLDFDVIMVESDVIWAPGFTRYKNELFDRSFFLDFDNMKHALRIAYAPSMANASFSSDEEIELSRLLRNFDAISCRESYQKEVLQRLTGRDVLQVLDPVMLLTASEYFDVISPPLSSAKYLLLYLPVDDNKVLRKVASSYAKEHSLEIIEISTEYKFFKGETSLLAAGPEEFLSAIYYSDMIFTNSFHAICFSLVFQKQFCAFSRRYEGKVFDICKQFNLENRFIRSTSQEIPPPIDYSKSNIMIEKRRNESIQWLISQLNLKKD